MDVVDHDVVGATVEVDVVVPVEAAGAVMAVVVDTAFVKLFVATTKGPVPHTSVYIFSIIASVTNGRRIISTIVRINMNSLIKSRINSGM